MDTSVLIESELEAARAALPWVKEVESKYRVQKKSDILMAFVTL